MQSARASGPSLKCSSEATRGVVQTTNLAPHPAQAPDVDSRNRTLTHATQTAAPPPTPAPSAPVVHPQTRQPRLTTSATPMNNPPTSHLQKPPPPTLGQPGQPLLACPTPPPTQTQALSHPPTPLLTAPTHLPASAPRASPQPHSTHWPTQGFRFNVKHGFSE